MKTKILIDSSGKQHHITKELSRGGQGAVFRTTDTDLAIKVELNPSSGEFVIGDYAIINRKFTSLRLLPIPPDANITLPLSVLEDAPGYIMRLLNDMVPFGKAFDLGSAVPVSNEWVDSLIQAGHECGELFAKYIATGGVKRRLKAFMKAACYLAKLHGTGLVYCDISDNNLFVSSSQEIVNVWLIDADNVNFMNKTLKNGYYTPGYGAPEVVRGEGCSFYSDCYALAISLFWEATCTHPFKGAMTVQTDFDDDFAEDSDEKAYGGELPWICDSDDNCNEGSTLIPHSLIMGNKLLAMFERMFSSTGRNNPILRPSMFELSCLIARAHDSTIKCPCCCMEYDYFENIICPWSCTTSLSEIPPHVIIVRTYYNNTTDENEVHWEFVACINDESVMIELPKRVVSWNVIKDIDRPAFELILGEHIEIKNLQEFKKVVYSADNSEIFGSFVTIETDFALVVLENSEVEKRIEFEVIR